MTRIVPALLAIALVLASCQVTERSQGGPVVIRPDTPESTLVGLSDVLRGKERVAVLRRYRFGEDDARYVIRIYDLRDRPLGYILPDGKTYRVRAHGGSDLVSSATTTEKNVAALLGIPRTPLRIKPVKGPSQGG